MGLKTTTGTASTRENQNLALNIAVECPACSPWVWTGWSSSRPEWAWTRGIACPWGTASTWPP